MASPAAKLSTKPAEREPLQFGQETVRMPLTSAARDAFLKALASPAKPTPAARKAVQRYKSASR